MFQKRWFLVILVLMGLVTANFNFVLAQDSVQTIQWDTASGSVNDAGMFVLSSGGSTYARANDGSVLMIIGSGTFNTDDRTIVSGGGMWTTFDWEDNPTGSGTFTVTELVSWEEEVGGLPAEFVVDEVGANEDVRAGVAVLRIAYSNEDGSPAGSGVVIIGCRLIGSPYTIIEGFVGTKDAEMFLETADSLPGVDVNLTIFHVVP